MLCVWEEFEGTWGRNVIKEGTFSCQEAERSHIFCLWECCHRRMLGYWLQKPRFMQFSGRGIENRNYLKKKKNQTRHSTLKVGVWTPLEWCSSGEAVNTSPCLCALMGGAFDVRGRGHLTSEVPEEDFQLLWLAGAPPVEVSSLVCLGTVIRLQDVKEAGHVGPNFLHQAVSDGADCVFVTFQEASNKPVIVSALGKESTCIGQSEGKVRPGLSSGLQPTSFPNGPTMQIQKVHQLKMAFASNFYAVSS